MNRRKDYPSASFEENLCKKNLSNKKLEARIISVQ